LLRYPRLHQRLVEVVSELLRERLSPTSTYVESLISIERAYINTNHPDFLGAAGAMANLETESKKKKKTDSKRKVNKLKILDNKIHKITTEYMLYRIACHLIRLI
jgi:dynamin 1-like protein